MDLFECTLDSRSSTMEPDSTDHDPVTPYDSDSYSPRSCEFDLQSASNRSNSPDHHSPSPSPPQSPQIETSRARPLTSTSPVPWEISDDEAEEEEIEGDEIMEQILKKIGATDEEIKNSKRHLPHSERDSDTETAKERKRLCTVKEGILGLGLREEVDLPSNWVKSKDRSIRLKRGINAHRTTSFERAINWTNDPPEVATHSEEGQHGPVSFIHDKLNPLRHSNGKDAESDRQPHAVGKGINNCVVAAIENLVIPEVCTSKAKQDLIDHSRKTNSEAQDESMSDEPQRDSHRAVPSVKKTGPLPRARTYMNPESMKHLDRFGQLTRQCNATFKEGRGGPTPECSSVLAESSGDDETSTPRSPPSPVPGCGSFQVHDKPNGSQAVEGSHGHKAVKEQMSKFSPAVVLSFDGTQKSANEENPIGAIGPQGTVPATALTVDKYSTLPPWEQQRKYLAEQSRERMMMARRDLGCMDVPLPPIPSFAFGSVNDNMHLPPVTSQPVPPVSSNEDILPDNGDVSPCFSPVLTKKSMNTVGSSGGEGGYRILPSHFPIPPSHPVAGYPGSLTRCDPAMQLNLLAQQAEERRKAEAAESDKDAASSYNGPVFTFLEAPPTSAREISLNATHFSLDQENKRRQAVKQQMGMGLETETAHFNQCTGRPIRFWGENKNNPRRGSNHALQHHQMHLMLLEQQNKKRLLAARKNEAEAHGREKAALDAQIQAQELAQKAQAQKSLDILTSQRSSMRLQGPGVRQGMAQPSEHTTSRPTNMDEWCKPGACRLEVDNCHCHVDSPRPPVPMQSIVAHHSDEDFNIPRPPTRPGPAASQHVSEKAFQADGRRKEQAVQQDYREKLNTDEHARIHASPTRLGMQPASRNASWKAFQEDLSRKTTLTEKSPPLCSDVPTEDVVRRHPHPPSHPPLQPPLGWQGNSYVGTNSAPLNRNTAIPQPPTYPPLPPPDMPNGIWVRTITSPDGETTTMMQIDHPFLDFQNGVEVTTTTVKTATEVTTTTVTSLLPMMMGTKGNKDQKEDATAGTEKEKDKDKVNEDEGTGLGSLGGQDDDLYD